MSIHKIPGVRVCLLFSAGILFQKFSGWESVTLVIVVSSVLILLTIFTYLSKNKILITASLTLLIFIMGVYRTLLTNQPALSDAHITNLGVFDRFVVVDGWIKDKTRYSFGNTVLDIRVQSITSRGIRYDNVIGDIRTFVKDSLHVFGYGDEIKARGLLIEPRGQRNPGGLDYKKFLSRKGIWAELRIPAALNIEVLQKHGSGNFLRRALSFQVRNRLEQILESYHTGQNLEFLKGILLGNRSGLEPEVLDSFRDTGTIHILAVSGLHVGFVILLAGSLLQLGNVPRLKYIPFLLMFTIILYMFIIGFRPPVVRAGVFTILYLLGIILQRRRDNFNILGVTAFILLLINPLSLFDPGFQLSFAAVTGIFLVLHFVKSSDRRTFFSSRGSVGKKKWYYDIGILVVISFGAFAATSLFSAYHFNQIAPGSIVLNLIVIPLASMIVMLGFIELLLGMIVPFMAVVLSFTVNLLVDTIIAVNNFVAGWNVTKIIVGHTEIIGIVLVLSLCFILFKIYRSNLKYKSVVMASLIVVAVITGKWWTLSGNTMKVTFLDVGQADAIMVSFPEDKHFLIDTGGRFESYDAGRSHIVPYLKWAGIRKLDGIFITHLERDHYGGIVSVLKAVSCDTLYTSMSIESDSTMQAIMMTGDNRSIGRKILKAGDYVSGNNAWSFEIHSPQLTQNSGSSNESSLVFTLRYGETTVLFTGDIGFETEKQLLSLDGKLKSDILKVPHHGSKNSSSEEFLEVVKPAVAIIQAGRFNSFGHPALETLQRLDGINAKVYITSREGAIAFESDGKTIVLQER